MIEFGWQFFAVGIPAIIFGGMSKAGFGSGAAFVGGAILALVVPPGAALGIVLPLFMLVDAATLRSRLRGRRPATVVISASTYSSLRSAGQSRYSRRHFALGCSQTAKVSAKTTFTCMACHI